MGKVMNIGQVAKLTGLNDKTLRYYESIGLVTSSRATNGYRTYSDQNIADCHFLASARQSGFSLEECKTLLELMRDNDRQSKDVKDFVAKKLAQLEAQIQTLTKMKSSLDKLSDRCNGNDGSQCAIIEGLQRSASQRGAPGTPSTLATPRRK